MVVIESPSKEYVEEEGMHKIGYITKRENDKGLEELYIRLPALRAGFVLMFNNFYEEDIKRVMSGDTTHYHTTTVIPRYNVYKNGIKASIALARYTENKMPFLFLPKTSAGKGQWKKKSRHQRYKTQRDYYIFNITDKHIIVPEKSAMYFDVKSKYGVLSPQEKMRWRRR